MDRACGVVGRSLRCVICILVAFNVRASDESNSSIMAEMLLSIDAVTCPLACQTALQYESPFLHMHSVILRLDRYRQRALL